MAAFLDICKFLPTAGGTTDWTFAVVVQGYQSPASAGASNGRLYKYRAESSDLTQWEIGEGAYNAATGTFARTTVLFTSAGTATKLNFSAPPQVAIVALKEDLISVEEANSFTAAQQSQARSNIGAAGSLRTRQVLTSGSGTYVTPAGCKTINVRMVGGGAGGGGGGGAGATASGTGGTTAFGTSLLIATGGNGAGGGGSAGNSGGVASGGDINIQGGSGAPSPGAGGTANGVTQGGMGGSSHFGGAGYAGWNGSPGSSASAGSGSGGGGGGANSSGGGGSGGGAGAYCEKLIVSPLASYAYQVGGGSVGGGAGSGGASGGNGANGIIIIDEYY